MSANDPALRPGLFRRYAGGEDDFWPIRGGNGYARLFGERELKPIDRRSCNGYSPVPTRRFFRYTLAICPRRNDGLDAADFGKRLTHYTVTKTELQNVKHPPIATGTQLGASGL